MKKLSLVLATAALVSLTGCQLISSWFGTHVPAGQIPAEGNYNLVVDVVTTYEAYLDADTVITDDAKIAGHAMADNLEALFDTEGMVSVALAQAYGLPVFDAHDVYVLADPALSALQQTIRLDNTAILRESFTLALLD